MATYKKGDVVMFCYLFHTELKIKVVSIWTIRDLLHGLRELGEETRQLMRAEIMKNETLG